MPSQRASSRRRRSVLAIGVDLGGTKTEVAVVDAEGRIATRRRYPTDAARPADAVLADVEHFIRETAPDIPANVPVGVGIAGQVEPGTGLVFGAPNLGWRDVPLGDTLARRLGRVVVVLNDVQAATYAEWRYGSGKGSQALVCCFVGTGIGAGLVLGDRLWRGANGSAGEIGHVPIELEGDLCTCGNQGCLETIAGGWGIAHQARKAARQDPVAGQALVEAVGGDLDRLTAEHVFQLSTMGDSLASRVITRAAEALGAGLGALANLFNPDTLVLGGGIPERQPGFYRSAVAALERHALPSARLRLTVRPAAFGNEAGVIGAALYALEVGEEF